MSRLFKEALAAVPGGPTLAVLIMFFVVFVGIIVWVYRRSARRHYQHMAEMPLDGRNHDE